MTMITTMAQKFNGITVAFLMGGVNSLFGVLVAFGVQLTDQEIAALIGFLNFAVTLGVWIAHRVGEDHAQQAAAAASSTTTRQSAQAVQPTVELLPPPPPPQTVTVTPASTTTEPPAPPAPAEA